MPTAAAIALLDAQVQARAVRGSLLFHLALAEALAGDAVRGSLSPEGIGGWALDVGADGYEVTAVGRGDAPDTRVRVTFAPNGAPIVERVAGPAGPRRAGLARVREAAAEQGERYGGRWRALPIPPPLDGRAVAEVEAYLVRIPDRPQDLAAGLHWRLVVAWEDGAVLDARPACSTDLIVPDAARRAAETPLALSHPDDDVPSEVHVMLSLQHGLGLLVRTPRSGLRWRVDGETVSRVSAPQK